MNIKISPNKLCKILIKYEIPGGERSLSLNTQFPGIIGQITDDVVCGLQSENEKYEMTNIIQL